MRFATAPVNGIDLAYTALGEGPPVVLVHGLACGRRMWLHQMRALAADYRVIAYDQRGHGRSGAPDAASAYSSAHLARDLVGLMDHLGIERAHLVGFSLGGGPAMAVAASRPERVASLILADVGAGAESPVLLPSLTRRWIAIGHREGMAGLAEDMLRGEFFKTYAGRGPRERRHMGMLIRSTPLRGLLFTLSEVLAKRRSLYRATGILRAVRVPTLVLRGERDEVCRAATKLLAGTIPGARDATIPRAGHMAPVENPDAFTGVVASFLADHR